MGWPRGGGAERPIPEAAGGPGPAGRRGRAGCGFRVASLSAGAAVPVGGWNCPPSIFLPVRAVLQPVLLPSSLPPSSSPSPLPLPLSPSPPARAGTVHAKNRLYVLQRLPARRAHEACLAAGRPLGA